MPVVEKDKRDNHEMWSFAFKRRIAKVHLLAYMADKTRCGRPISGKNAVYWTEDGVEYATCYRCKDLYDTQED